MGTPFKSVSSRTGILRGTLNGPGHRSVDLPPADLPGPVTFGTVTPDDVLLEYLRECNGWGSQSLADPKNREKTQKFFQAFLDEAAKYHVYPIAYVWYVTRTFRKRKGRYPTKHEIFGRKAVDGWIGEYLRVGAAQVSSLKYEPTEERRRLYETLGDTCHSRKPPRTRS